MLLYGCDFLQSENYDSGDVLDVIADEDDAVSDVTTDISESQKSDSHIIEDFECIYQMPELPTGCEITAMAMVLNYYGYNIDKTELALNYMPTIMYSEYYNDENVEDKTNLNNYFIGDPTTSSGYVAGTGAITIAANNYLSEVESVYTAKDITGYTEEELYKFIEDDIPVVVWVTIGMEERPETEFYYVDDENYIEWTTEDHGAVLIGYTEDTVTIADPISGIVEYDKEIFENIYNERGCCAVMIE
jgi:uncharacterized protein YvpB